MKCAALVMLLALCVFHAGAESRTWFITPDGTGDVPYIRTGVELASRGDTLLLADGIYTGPMNTNLSYDGKAIVVRSQSGNPHGCIIDCEGSPSNVQRGFDFSRHEGRRSVLEGVTVRNGYSNEGAGIWCWSSSPTINNVILAENHAVYFGGGMYCGRGAVPTLTNVTLCWNSADQGGGVYCTYYASATIKNSIIAFTRKGGAVVLTGNGTAPAFECSDVYGNAGGDWDGSIASQLGVAGNISEDPLFCLDQNLAAPYGLRSDSPCIPAPGSECDTMGAGGVGCSSTIEATVEIHPRVVALNKRTRRLTCYIELFQGYNPLLIDPTTVFFNGVVRADEHPTSVGDFDGDGIPDRMVKFSWAKVISTLEGYGRVRIEVSGQAGGMNFLGADTILVQIKETRILRSPAVDGHQTDGGLFVSASGGDDKGFTIGFNVPEASMVGLAVYDVRGRLVRQLLNQVKSANFYEITWDGKDESAARIAPGVYFVTLEIGTRRSTTKAVVLR